MKHTVALRITHCLFDKTGTLTTDELTAQGVVNEGPGHSNAASAASASSAATTASPATASSDTSDFSATSGSPVRELEPMRSASREVCAVVGGCHSLAEVTPSRNGGREIQTPPQTKIRPL